MSAIRLAVMLALVSACASVDVAPTIRPPGVFTVDARNPSGAFTVWVFDNSGLVTGARRWEDPGQAMSAANQVAVASPESSEVAVGWVGGICYHGPTVTVDGPNDGLIFTVRPDEGTGPRPGTGCPDIGVFFGVVLTLSAPVTQEHVAVEVVR